MSRLDASLPKAACPRSKRDAHYHEGYTGQDKERSVPSQRITLRDEQGNKCPQRRSHAYDNRIGKSEAQPLYGDAEEHLSDAPAHPEYHGSNKL